MKVNFSLFIKVLVITTFFCITTHAEEDFDIEAKSEACAQCHGDKNDDKNGAHIVTQEIVDTTIHEDMYCLECHQSLKNEVYDDTINFAHQKPMAKVNCGVCHEDAAEVYTKHGTAAPGSDSLVPNCASCHGTHNILEVSDTNSQVNEKNLVGTCAKCHENLDAMEKYGILNTTIVGKYSSSVHGLASENDSIKPAGCKECHFTDESAHKIYSPGDPTSTINHFLIPQTCGSCHEDEEKLYRDGIHGKLSARGETDSPVCTGCHGAHTIKKVSNSESTVNHSNLATATCTPCHNSASLSSKFGIDADKRVSYIDDYHGRKSGVGDTRAANCASCHNAHDIRTQKDTLSTINPANLVETCSQCHEGIGQEIAETEIHSINRGELSFWERVFTIIYIVLISLTIGGMFFYVLFDFIKTIRSSKEGEQITRMTLNERIQHAILAVSFTALVITGFALRHSDSWWADLLFGRSGGFWVRHQIHIVSAVIIVLVCLYHLWYLRSKRGFKFLLAIAPSYADAKHAIQMTLYNIGLRKDRPYMGRFTFAEKMEYWALVWGMIVMTVTGLVLWYDTFFVQYIPKEAIDVLRVIHYYEAVLASLAILVWHFYSTVFHPHVYPMNFAWITGKMPKDLYEHERGPGASHETDDHSEDKKD